MSACAALSSRLRLPVIFRLLAFASWNILSSWGVVPPVRLAYCPPGLSSWTTGRPQEGCHVPHPSSAVGGDAPSALGSGVRAESYLVPSAVTHITVFVSHRPVSERDGVS